MLIFHEHGAINRKGVEQRERRGGKRDCNHNGLIIELTDGDRESQRFAPFVVARRWDETGNICSIKSFNGQLALFTRGYLHTSNSDGLKIYPELRKALNWTALRNKNKTFDLNE